MNAHAETQTNPHGVWRTAKATRAHVVIDADEYFSVIRSAMQNARQRIMLVGWDFDTRIPLGRGRRRPGDPPRRLGDFLLWLAEQNPALEIHILKWNFAALKLLGRGQTLLDAVRWAAHPRITFKLDSAHPAGCSHHQKIVVIDDCFAACGGIDMTSNRWDTRDHGDDDRRRKLPNGKRYDPWHDATMLVEGEAAAALGDLARERWVHAGGNALEPCRPQTDSIWPQSLDAEFRDVTVGIARTRSCYDGHDEVREIETLFTQQIARARRFIYAENQYFASRRIAEAIALRMAEPDPPEIVVVNPDKADGWLEQKAMDSARAHILRSIGEHDRQKRFGIYIPYTAGGTPIYVHAKLMIVDDEIVRVGSANMNNRSLGLDSECDLFIDARANPGAEISDTIRALRIGLLAEHTGVTEAEMARLLEVHGSMQAAIRAIPEGGRSLRRLDIPELTEAEQAVAESQALDPESPDEMFEPFATGSIFERSRILRRPRPKKAA